VWAEDDLVSDVLSLGVESNTWSKFLDRYGVRRHDAAFWKSSDFFNDRHRQIDPISAGILDISRYVSG
jgi:hypothetical protein